MAEKTANNRKTFFAELMVNGNMGDVYAYFPLHGQQGNMEQDAKNLSEISDALSLMAADEYGKALMKTHWPKTAVLMGAAAALYARCVRDDSMPASMTKEEELRKNTICVAGAVSWLFDMQKIIGENQSKGNANGVEIVFAVAANLMATGEASLAAANHRLFADSVSTDMKSIETPWAAAEPNPISREWETLTPEALLTRSVNLFMTANRLFEALQNRGYIR